MYDMVMVGARTAFATVRKLHDSQASAANGELLPASSPMEDSIEDGIFPLLVDFLVPDIPSELQLEAAHTLTNLTGGSSVDASAMLVASSGVSAMLRMLLSPSGEVREQIVWLVSNVAADGGVWRAALLECTVDLPHNQGKANLVQLLVMHAELAHQATLDLNMGKGDGGEFLAAVSYTDAKNQTRFLHHWGRRVARVLSNLCLVKESSSGGTTTVDKPQFDLLEPALPLMGKLLLSDDKEVIDYILIALDALLGGVTAHGASTYKALEALLRCQDEVKRGLVLSRSTA
jgi:hypothetical protein